MRRQTDVWCLLYGEEWRAVREHAVGLLSEWCQRMPHRWPLTVAQEVWEELHWRFFEELREVLRLLKKEAQRETLTQQEITFHALLPGPDGLQLPKTFDLLNPDGWFKNEVEPRIERRQERALWRLTWDGTARHTDKPAGLHAGGDADDKAGMARVQLIGPKLTQEESNRAGDRAPVDRKGVLLCWAHLTHLGCGVADCQRSHAVQTQLLRRGGLKRMKAETADSAAAKIQALRAQHSADKASKKAGPKRQAGGGEPPPEAPQPKAAAEGTGRAGGEVRVTFNDVPEESSRSTTPWGRTSRSLLTLRVRAGGARTGTSTGHTRGAEESPPRQRRKSWWRRRSGSPWARSWGSCRTPRTTSMLGRPVESPRTIP